MLYVIVVHKQRQPTRASWDAMNEPVRVMLGPDNQPSDVPRPQGMVTTLLLAISGMPLIFPLAFCRTAVRAYKQPYPPLKTYYYGRQVLN
jgi:hypothetical protein